ncbi:tannase/feruloyl esterase family alpha/beta hydrolase [Variovorax sp. J2P1-59]|uniref:tannase/feruloyl esterase family alpha/beta hydrolase n=1 Tax=Variovorax flavidus TaxID=3053501 RepID=UPI0025782257|nr:tannase/feruloyl esterase family alpha/beta hydrolase [Variovorax sp. J2P1-59]MDM0073101.1 tannase/feruloyl esterase family alpha/beta hydrolase [Variovorax sp. J2P1-59]
MVQIKLAALRPTMLLISTAAVLAACGGGSSNYVLPPTTGATPPVAGPGTPTQAQPGKLLSCDDLASKAALAGTVYTSVTSVAAGGLTVAGISTPVPAHCLVKGKMNERTSTVDGQTYAIGFEMRLPVEWNGRFFYQANGGLDGSVVTATGGVGGGGPLSTALHMGFAVISSDAGHSSPTPSFGLDPQARVDYGYNAVAQLTPMAKNLITKAYGRGPDRSYLGGCSNGGRHAMVAASRYADLYDGFLAGDPGFNLPKAAVAQLYGVQQYATVTTGLTGQNKPDLQTAFTQAELNTVAQAVAARCDALDGLTDGIVSDVPKCKTVFNLATDVPSCSGARDGTCLTSAQKTALSNVFTGARNSASTAIYSSFPFDAGINGANWRQWKFANSQVLDTGAVGFVFSTLPLGPSRPSGIDFALAFSMDSDAPSIYAASGIYAESSMSFMTPPNPTQMKTLRDRGSKLLVYHGTSDPVFSSDDTTNWYEGLRANNGGDASSFARYFPVPGMNHCAGGPATDQFDMLSPLVAWVEQGKSPDSVKATARGAGANVVNAEIPATWSASRTRPLCPYPKVATYTGSNPEDAASFSCK